MGLPWAAVVPDDERRAGVDGATPKACPSCGTRYAADALFCSLDGAPLTTSPGAVAAAAASDPYLGREILGHIEIRQLVGIGAMGRVYRAFQKGIDRDVAVKVLHRELSANQTLVARFHREAKVASRLAHPHVVHVLLVGQLPDGALYIVMEYLDGISLQSALAAAGGAMPLPRALHIALQLCDAAGEAHAQGIVHRDLKPENVMLVLRADDPDFVKVLDFGIARLNWDEPSTSTQAGLIFGTARYISPEGAQGERVGPQGDVYSIATMTYQMLAGRTPFDADQTVALLVQQIHDAPPLLKGIERSSYVPDLVASVVMRNLSKRADERSTDARAFGRSLLEAAVSSGLSAQDILARPALLGGGRASHASVVQMPSMQRTKQLALEPSVAARMEAAPHEGRASEPGDRGIHPTAFETPALLQPEDLGRLTTRTEIADPAGAPPTAETTRWSPPVGFGVRLAKPPWSDVAATMDDQQASRAVAGPGRVTQPPIAQVPPSSGFGVGRGPPTTNPPSSSVDATLAGDRAAVRDSPANRRTTLLIASVLFVGVGMAGWVWRGLPSRAPMGPAPSGAEPPHADLAAAGPASPLGELSESDSARASATQALPAPEGSVVPPLARVSGPPSALVPSIAAGGVRVVLETSSNQPVPGQPVDFEARVVGGAGARKVEAARFRIVGPGLVAGTELPSPDDGSGVFRTTFTFLQPGRFDVRFGARADGVSVGASRAVLVGDSAVPPSANPASTETSAKPQQGGKWL
jgi:serine/threonine protein kinase